MAEQLFTFGVYTEEVRRAIEAGQFSDETAPYEEIDVQAESAVEALRKAKDESDDLYGEGATLFPLPPGGGGGLIHIHSQ